MEVDIEVGKKISFQYIIYFKKILERFKIINYKSAFISISPSVANFLIHSDSEANQATIK